MEINIYRDTISFQAETAAEEFQLESLKKQAEIRGIQTYTFANMDSDDHGFGIHINKHENLR